jgi:hypothetical protein
MMKKISPARRIACIDASLSRQLGKSLAANARLTKRIAALRGALEAIKRAVIEGRAVCNEVAWCNDDMTTLHEFCDQTLVVGDKAEVRA